MSATTAGSLIKAAFGAVSATGVGVPAADVTQRVVSVPEVTAVVQPAGRAGAVTPSKFSLKTLLKFPQVGVGVAVLVDVPVGVAVFVCVAVFDGVNVAVEVGVFAGGVNSSAPISGVATLRVSPSMSVVMPPIGVPAFDAGDVPNKICRSVPDKNKGSPETELASLPVNAL